MSIFDYPRLNFTGDLYLNPPTANNDDYAEGAAYKGEPLGMMVSGSVSVPDYGMDDATLVTWMQKPAVCDVTDPENGKPTGGTQRIIPAEWNYYGDASSKASGCLSGAQSGFDQDTDQFDGTTFRFNGVMTDLNSEGSPPGTQFFIDSFTLERKGETLLQGRPKKATGQWLNFYRNANLTQDAGSSTYTYQVLEGPLETPVAEFRNGVIIRANIFNSRQPQFPKGDTQEALSALYLDPNKTALEKVRPAVQEIQLTVAPLTAGETIKTAPVGRLLTCATANVPTKSRNNNGRGKLALGPAVFSISDCGSWLHAELSATFPEDFQPSGTTVRDPNGQYYIGGSNPKLNFGRCAIELTNGTRPIPIATIDYTDLRTGNAKGWVFDLPLGSEAQEMLANSDATFQLTAPRSLNGPVLSEVNYYVVSNSQSVYAEQGSPQGAFLNFEYPMTPATLMIYHRGEPISDCQITVWEYDSTPMTQPGAPTRQPRTLKPGEPISVDTSNPGNKLLTFTVNGGESPPNYYPQFGNTSTPTFSSPPYVTNWPQLGIRILPNEDFSQYYEDPSSPEPTANDSLTWDLLYRRVLRTYALLYPAMNYWVNLGSESAVKGAASGILCLTEDALFNHANYMPKTRDLSATRRTLLRAYCWRIVKPKKDGTE